MDARWPLLAVAASLLAGCGAPEDAPDGSACRQVEPLPVATAPVAVFETSMGTFRADLYLEEVPVTVSNFVCLAQAGFYDGTTFHRIQSNFILQGGDPNSRNGNASDDGLGGPGYAVADEIHPYLKHDAEGILSMAADRPNTGGSQFFITFGNQAHLDDKQTVFGRVRAADLGVLGVIHHDAATPDGAPRVEVELESVVVEAGEAPRHAPGVSLWTPDGEAGVASAGGTARFLVVAESLNLRRGHVDVKASAAGATATVEPAFRSFDLPARDRAAFIVTVDVPASGPDSLTVAVTASMAGGPDAKLELLAVRGGVGPASVHANDRPTLHYIGMSEDGRVFATSRADVSRAAVEDGLAYGMFEPVPQDKPQTRALAAYVAGFQELAIGTPVGGSDVGRLAPEDAYGPTGECQADQTCLVGRGILFQVDVLATG